MRGIRYFASCAALLSLVLCFSSQSSAADETTSTLPKWTWKMLVIIYPSTEKEVKVEVRSSKGDLYTTTPFPNYPNCAGCLTVIDPRGTIHQVTDEAGNNLPEYDVIKGAVIFDLPLAKGKKWSYDVQRKTAQGIVDLNYSFKVRKLTTVKVQAGKFEAFEVERTMTRKGDMRWSQVDTFYFSTELGVCVKLESQDSKNTWEVKLVQ
jgi:hypothetical protein